MAERTALLGSTLVRCAPRRNRHRRVWTMERETLGGVGLALLGVALVVLLLAW